MRDPARIHRVCDLLECLWSKYPDLRLGQLIYALSDYSDPFYFEDFNMENKINAAILYGLETVAANGILQKEDVNE